MLTGLEQWDVVEGRVTWVTSVRNTRDKYGVGCGWGLREDRDGKITSVEEVEGHWRAGGG